MVKSELSIDWDAVRLEAGNCLNATWSLVCCADFCSDEDFDDDGAKAYLNAIGKAATTFKKAYFVLQPGIEQSDKAEDRHSQVFDTIALATANQPAKPDFKFSSVVCATAHQAAFELLRMALMRIENLGHSLGLMEIRELESLSGKALRTILAAIGSSFSSETIVAAVEAKQIQSWIDREWAAVNRMLDDFSPIPDTGLHGVSIFNAMLFIDKSGDEDAAKDLVSRFSKKKTIRKPHVIGKCPHEGRRSLHRISEVVRCMIDFFAIDKNEARRLTEYLQTIKRAPTRK